MQLSITKLLLENVGELSSGCMSTFSYLVQLERKKQTNKKTKKKDPPKNPTENKTQCVLKAKVTLRAI